MKENYTKESWQKVLNAGARGRETNKLKFQRIEQEYLKNPKICKQCRKPIPYLKRLRYNFCNNTCSALYNNSRRIAKAKPCINCGNPIGKGSHKFCSRFCEKNYQYKNYISRWLSGEISGNKETVSGYIRRWLSEQQGEQCWKCGWKEINLVTSKVPVQVNHIDGSALNNRPENLELICPNCHSLTATFGGLNRGNGRVWRKERYMPVKHK